MVSQVKIKIVFGCIKLLMSNYDVSFFHANHVSFKAFSGFQMLEICQLFKNNKKYNFSSILLCCNDIKRLEKFEKYT